MLYYKCTTNGGNMKVQKFCPTALISILSHIKPEHTKALIEARDQYLSTPDHEVPSVTVSHKDPLGYGNYGKTEIVLEEENDEIKIAYKPHNERKVDFTITPPKAEDEVAMVHKKVVILEQI